MEPQAHIRRPEPKPRYNLPSRSSVLLKQVRQHNDSSQNRGLTFLRTLVMSVAKTCNWDGVKPVLHALNGKDPVQAVAIARDMQQQQYDCADEHFRAHQVALLVKKYPFPGSDELAEENALKKFLEGESFNARNNIMFKQLMECGADLENGFLHHVRDYLYRLLGDEPDWREVAHLAGWGPGANVGITGRFTNFARKFLAEEWTCTAEALPYFLKAAVHRPEFWEILGLTRSYPDVDAPQGTTYRQVICVDVDEFIARAKQRIKIVDYNKIAFVLKEATCKRTVSPEPLCLAWIQTGLGESMRLRLRRFGIDLRDQSRNQAKAREGSLGGVNPFVTLDLSNASGSIGTEMVRMVLALTLWFESLDDVRSKGYRLPGGDVTYPYHGFVSMGNGFCFPLETAIFAAACYAAYQYTGSEQDFTVYGDDIIVRQNEALVVVEILNMLGFSVNTDKSFFFGPFRESCGADWYSGENVRPVVLDTSLCSFEERIRVHNAFARLPNAWAARLAEACLAVMPSFYKYFVRPFADHTDEAIDGRWMHWPVHDEELVEETYKSPAWYGLAFEPVKDKAIEAHAAYPVALYYAALSGANSKAPFAERRETSMRVARFSHSGNTSSWLPLPRPLMAVEIDPFDWRKLPGVYLANLVVRRMGAIPTAVLRQGSTLPS